MATTWTQKSGMDSPTDTDNVTPASSPASDTDWTQKSGMGSATETDNIETLLDQAQASADAAAASATAAAASEVASDASETASAASEAAAAASETAAAASAATATTKAAEAASSATDAQTAQTAAEAAQTASEAAQAAAETAEANAATSASSASSSATAAQSSADAALAALDNFDDRYLGQKASDPTVDNDGNPLIAGALYFNTTDDTMKVYDGSNWVAAYASLAGTLLVANNLSDLDNAATARTNLGLGTAATTASTDYATAAQGALADSAVQPGDLAAVATTGAYSDLSGTPTLGTAAAADTTDFDPAGTALALAIALG